MTLGIAVSHYDARNDVRDLVELLARRHHVIVFGDSRERDRIPQHLEYRQIRAVNGPWSWLWYYLFSFFGRLPASRENFLVTELFKLDTLPPGERKRVERRLRLRLALPKWISYDFLLRRVAHTDCTDLRGVDGVIFITAVSAASLLARTVRQGLPHGIYVYSWDHACKHPSFSRQVSRHWVWNHGIQEDLALLQGIDPVKVRVVGSTQLTYLKDYLGEVPRGTAGKSGYVYYGCGVGHPGMAAQEVALIRWLAGTLAAVAPDVRLLVRPYPMLADTAMFTDLRRLSNVDFDESYRQRPGDRSLSRSQIMTKLSLQDRALAFVHCGTTMGFEGAYLDTPILFLAPGDFEYDVPSADFSHLGKFIRQYHNLKYMVDLPFANVIRRTADLEPVLRGVVANPATFLAYNHAIREATLLRSLDEIADAMLADLESPTQP